MLFSLYFLIVVVKQSYETRVQALRTVNGFSAILDCVVNPSYMRDYILVTSWVRDKSYNILPTASSIDSSDNKYHMMSDGRLLIWQVGPQDARSTYQCRTLHRLTAQTSVSPPGKLVTFGKLLERKIYAQRLINMQDHTSFCEFSSRISYILCEFSLGWCV